jgi:hypothetical protein
MLVSGAEFMPALGRISRASLTCQVSGPPEPDSCGKFCYDRKP